MFIDRIELKDSPDGLFRRVHLRTSESLSTIQCPPWVGFGHIDSSAFGQKRPLDALDGTRDSRLALRTAKRIDDQHERTDNEHY
jgi:hypothetical protein